MDKIPDITNLATNTTLNANINEVKGEIPDIINLDATAALNAKMNKVNGKTPTITNVASLLLLLLLKIKYLMFVT